VVVSTVPVHRVDSHILLPGHEAAPLTELAYWQLHSHSSFGQLLTFLHALRFNAVNFFVNQGYTSRPLFTYEEPDVELPSRELGVGAEFWQLRYAVSRTPSVTIVAASIAL
jgi:hypothetical protein